MKRNPSRSATRSLTDELAELRRLDLSALKQRWRALYGSEAPVQRGHLRQPCRREPIQDLDYSLTAGPLAQALQCFKHRHVRLTGSVLLDALAATDSRRTILCD